jgi:NAD(P)-dependent dehydrogenase (short-subunit alcohol dehydrogenase family)
MDGKVVVVTGAGRGVGRAYALEFARQGAQVVVNDLGGSSVGEGDSTGPAAEVVDEIAALGGEAIADGHDVADFDAAGELIRRTISNYGRLDVLVNNAGILRDRMLVSMSIDDWDAVIRVHLRGTFATTRWAAEHWRARSKVDGLVGGRLINTSSSSGLFSNLGQANYAAAKAGIAAFTVVASRELARYGVTANCLYPTALSRLTEDLFREKGYLDSVDEFQPLDPVNFAPVVVWLSSSRSAGITGRVFGLRGGRITVAEGWAGGPTREERRSFTYAELDDIVPELVREAAPNSDMRGLREPSALGGPVLAHAVPDRPPGPNDRGGQG